jgi:hypothetical protein
MWRTLLAVGRPVTFYKPAITRSLTSSLVALLLLLSGVELKFDPSAIRSNATNTGHVIRMGLLNAHSIIHKSSLVRDMITTQRIDAMAIIEFWIINDDPEAVKLDAVPTGCSVIHLPRSSAIPCSQQPMAVVCVSFIIGPSSSNLIRSKKPSTTSRLSASC